MDGVDIFIRTMENPETIKELEKVGITQIYNWEWKSKLYYENTWCCEKLLIVELWNKIVLGGEMKIERIIGLIGIILSLFFIYSLKNTALETKLFSYMLSISVIYFKCNNYF